MCDPLRNVLCESKDAIWLKRMCFEKEALPTPDVDDLFDDTVPISSEGDRDLDPLSGTVHDVLDDEGPDSEDDLPDDLPDDDGPDSDDDSEDSEDSDDVLGLEDAEARVDDDATNAVSDVAEEEPRRSRAGRAWKPNSRHADFELNAHNCAACWTPAEKRFHGGMREPREVQFLKLDVPSSDAAEE